MTARDNGGQYNGSHHYQHHIRENYPEKDLPAVYNRKELCGIRKLCAFRLSSSYHVSNLARQASASTHYVVIAGAISPTVQRSKEEEIRFERPANGPTAECKVKVTYKYCTIAVGVAKPVQNANSTQSGNIITRNHNTTSFSDIIWARFPPNTRKHRRALQNMTAINMPMPKTVSQILRAKVTEETVIPVGRSGTLRRDTNLKQAIRGVRLAEGSIDGGVADLTSKNQ